MKMKLVISLVACMGLLACASNQIQFSSEVKSESKALSKKPTNILWIYIEDQNNWNNAYGDYTVNTPTIKSFADEGVRFNKLMQPAGVCSATRSALITGKYQTTLGIHNHRSSRSNYAGTFLPEGYQTVPELFKQAGYATFNIGKDDYNFKYNRAALYSEHPGPVKGHQGSQNGGEFDWAKQLKGKPFFGQIQLKGGKHNRNTMKGLAIDKVSPSSVTLPPYYPDTPAHRKEWAKHYETQQASDIELNNILADLKNNGLLENTAIFWFSDHGMVLLRHKQTMYEAGVHVPLLVNWPEGNDQLRKLGAVRDGLASGLDISATTLALAGIDIPDYYDGKNLFSADYKPREFVISAKDRMDHTFDRSRGVRTEQYRYIRNFNPERSHSQPQYRDKKPYTLEFKAAAKAGKLTKAQMWFVEPTKPVEELYDMAADPHQINNLALDPSYAKILLEHRQILLKWMAETDDKGAYPESDPAIREIIDMWGDKCVSSECQSYRERYSAQLNVSGEKLHGVQEWPSYLSKPE